MTLDDFKALCKRFNVAGDAELLVWSQSGHFAGCLEPLGQVVFAGPSPRDADSTGKPTVQLWPERSEDEQGAYGCPYCSSPAVTPDEPRCSSNWHTDKFVRTGFPGLTP